MTAPADTIELICKRCGATFSDERKRRGRNKGFCGEACRDAAIKRRIKRYRREGRYVRTFHCAVCEALFETESSTQTCSAECAATLQAWNVRKAAHLKKALGDFFDGVYPEESER
jgi:hypothetical protein